jgi:protein involved in polysaccharide export with SLBB domain
MKYPGSEHDIILREYDFLDVMEHNNVITVSGEVMQPTGISYEKGRNLYYYINNAGGFTDNAKRSRIYGISQSGAVTKLHANSVRDIEPGMNIVVPQKSSKKKMNTAEKIGIFSGIASLAAVIVAVLNVIKK